MGMHAIFAGEFGQCMLSGQGIQGDASLKRNGGLPSPLGHKSLLWLLTSTLAHGPFFRNHLSFIPTDIPTV